MTKRRTVQYLPVFMSLMVSTPIAMEPDPTQQDPQTPQNPPVVLRVGSFNFDDYFRDIPGSLEGDSRRNSLNRLFVPPPAVPIDAKDTAPLVAKDKEEATGRANVMHVSADDEEEEFSFEISEAEKQSAWDSLFGRAKGAREPRLRSSFDVNKTLKSLRFFVGKETVKSSVAKKQLSITQKALGRYTDKGWLSRVKTGFYEITAVGRYVIHLLEQEKDQGDDDQYVSKKRGREDDDLDDDELEDDEADDFAAEAYEIDGVVDADSASGSASGSEENDDQPVEEIGKISILNPGTNDTLELRRGDRHLLMLRAFEAHDASYKRNDICSAIDDEDFTPANRQYYFTMQMKYGWIVKNKAGEFKISERGLRVKAILSEQFDEVNNSPMPMEMEEEVIENRPAKAHKVAPEPQPEEQFEEEAADNPQDRIPQYFVYDPITVQRMLEGELDRLLPEILGQEGFVDELRLSVLGQITTRVQANFPYNVQLGEDFQELLVTKVKIALTLE